MRKVDYQTSPRIRCAACGRAILDAENLAYHLQLIDNCRRYYIDEGKCRPVLLGDNVTPTILITDTVHLWQLACSSANKAWTVRGLFSNGCLYELLRVKTKIACQAYVAQHFNTTLILKGKDKI